MFDSSTVDAHPRARTLAPRRRARILAALTLGVLAALAAAPATAHAQLEPERLHSAPLGVADGQYVRLSAYFVASEDGPPGYPPDPCRVTLRFLDQHGATLTQTVVLLAPGRAAQLDYRPTTLRWGQRVTVRAVLLGERGASGHAPRLIPSIEVIDVATGKTGVTSPGTIVGFNPQPDPPGTPEGFNPQPDPPGDVGIAGIAGSQVAHLTAAYVGLPSDSGFPPDPCDVELTFFSGDGAVIATRRATVQPGGTLSLDVNAGPLPAGARRRMYAKVAIVGAHTGFLTHSLEILDEASGRAAALMPSAFVQSWGWE